MLISTCALSIMIDEGDQFAVDFVICLGAIEKLV
jgi:hypothetical protein